MTFPIENRRIALIGGAGFIGHNLALSLKAKGADVHVIDSLMVNNLVSIGASENLGPTRQLHLALINERLDLMRAADILLHVQDAREYSALSRVLSTIDPQVIVHLAAVSHADRSNKDPHSTFDHSLRTLENALDFARNGVGHFIFLSSSMVYGNFPEPSISEDAPCDPLGIYGALKFAGERIVIAYNQVFDLPYTIVRPSALYGERCVSRRVGQAFIENTLYERGVTISGDGSDRLDFTYIGDLVNGIVKVIENEAARNQCFNLTYGSSRSIKDMLDILLEHFPDVAVSYKPRHKLMPVRGTLSVEKARSLIGYEPQYPLEKGYVDYIRWYKDLFKRNDKLFQAA